MSWSYCSVISKIMLVINVYLIFYIFVVGNIWFRDESLASYMQKREYVRIYFRPILTQIWVSRYILLKLPRYKFSWKSIQLFADQRAVLPDCERYWKLSQCLQQYRPNCIYNESNWMLVCLWFSFPFVSWSKYKVRYKNMGPIPTNLNN
jgi:hypothetical protein